jgi:hypothetical protein
MFRYILQKLFPWMRQKDLVTIHYAFPIVLFATLFASLAAVVSQDDSYVIVRTDTDTITEGGNFYIDVLISAHLPINAIDLTIAYPENQVVIESIDTGTSVITLWTETPYAKDGTIYIRGGTFRKGFLGEHTIARIKARGTESGIAKITLTDSQLIAGDGLGTEIPVTNADGFNEAKVTVMTVDGKVSTTATIAIITDTNGDGKVDITDISVFMSAWFTRGATFDFNNDGKMTFKDFSILLADTFTR